MHCLIYDPDSSSSPSYNMILILPRHSHIWSWFFPVTVLYIWSWFFPIMHCFIYDADSSPSCTVLNMILILPRHCLIIWSRFFPVTVLCIYDPDFFPVTVLYILSWFFPIMHCFIYDADFPPSWTVLNMILILPRHCLIYMIYNNNGGKQADVADTTERFCTKMCIFFCVFSIEIEYKCYWMNDLF
jgi:hypothetical protein